MKKHQEKRKRKKCLLSLIVTASTILSAQTILYARFQSSSFDIDQNTQDYQINCCIMEDPNVDCATCDYATQPV